LGWRPGRKPRRARASASRQESEESSSKHSPPVTFDEKKRPKRPCRDRPPCPTHKHGADTSLCFRPIFPGLRLQASGRPQTCLFRCRYTHLPRLQTRATADPASLRQRVLGQLSAGELGR
jgi:hypothetical protein